MRLTLTDNLEIKTMILCEPDFSLSPSVHRPSFPLLSKICFVPEVNRVEFLQSLVSTTLSVLIPQPPAGKLEEFFGGIVILEGQVPHGNLALPGHGPSFFSLLDCP